MNESPIVVQLRLSQAEWEYLAKSAKESDLSMIQVIRQAIREHQLNRTEVEKLPMKGCLQELEKDA